MVNKLYVSMSETKYIFKTDLKKKQLKIIDVILKSIYYEFIRLLSYTAELNIKLQFCYKLLSELVAKNNNNFVSYKNLLD